MICDLLILTSKSAGFLLRGAGALALSFGVAGTAAAAMVLIGHASLPKSIDDATVQKIYTGKIIEIGGVGVVPVNASVGSPLRARFLQIYLNQDEEKFVAYWTVRRYIGKGVPPKELSSGAEIANFVQSVPGAIGYIEESELRPGSGVNVLSRK